MMPPAIELGMLIDLELQRIGLACPPPVYWLGENPGTVLMFATEVDRQTFASLVPNWMFVCMPTDFWTIILPDELAHVLTELKATRAVA